MQLKYKLFTVRPLVRKNKIIFTLNETNILPYLFKYYPNIIVV